MMRRYYLFFLALWATLSGAWAQAVPNFALPNAADGQTVALADFADTKAVVVIFTSNDCPFDQYYRARINDLAGKHPASQVQVLLVNAHKSATESAQKMAQTAAKAGFKAPYLADKEQVAMRALGAKRSPEAFVLANHGGNFHIAYQGAIDNNPQVAADVKEHYLARALTAVLAGKKPALAHARAMGCIIKQH